MPVAPRAVLAALLATVLVATACRSGERPSAGASRSSGTTPGSSATAPGGSATASGSTAGVPGSAATTPPSGGVPRFDHIVVAVLENHAYSEIVGRPDAPFLNSLAAGGALLTSSYAVAHPSQPNYLALFSGSTQGLTSDSCPHSFAGPNLAAALRAAGLSFTGYSEGLPAAGYPGCGAGGPGGYARKHNPWVDFPALPAAVNQPLTAWPADPDRLPTVAFVVPDLNDDMHDGSVARGDAWLAAQLGGYAAWSRTHNSLLVVTADEDDTGHDNRIATILTGAHVRPGRYDTRIDHYGLLRTLLAAYRLTPFGAAATAPALSSVWAG